MRSIETSAMSRRWLLGPIAGVLVAGCFSQNDGGGCQTPTSLTGNGSFQYVCMNDEVACGRLMTSAPPIVVGGTFGLAYEDNDGVPWPVDTVSHKAVERDDTSFRALRAGRIGFIARDEDVAIDAIRLRVAEPDALRIARLQFGLIDDPLEMVRGMGRTPLRVRAVPMDARGDELSGLFFPTWTVDDPTVVSLQILPKGICELTLERPGETVLRVSYRSATASIRIVGRSLDDPWDAAAPDDPWPPSDASVGDASEDASEDAGEDAGADAASSDGGEP